MLNPDKVKLAIAPIGWTNDDMPDLGAENTFEQCISEMALAGFSGSEIGNKYPSDPAVLKPYLDIRGLQICNAWFSSYLTSKSYEETISAFKQHCDKLHALGAKVIGASEQGNSIQGCLDKSILDAKPVYTEAQWQTVARGFNEMGAYARSKGMYFTVHHHMGTGVQTAEEIDRLMELTDPELVFLLFDSGHLTFAGIDPVPVLEKYAQQLGVTDSLEFDGITTAKGNFDLTDAAESQIAWSGIGQYTDLINPCQYMTLMGVIAGGGQAAEPHIMARVQGMMRSGYEAKTKLTDVLLDSTACDALADMMHNNVVSMYGAWQFPDLYVCAKSGTAELGPTETPHATFAGFIRDETYPLAFIVIVEHGGSGSATCAPIAGQVLNACVQALSG